ncbi:hypothetical protein BB561_006091 [Smittium simulii]|uniref:GH16 domain-containing protein n=1 Tax=Smittium simulii TaxID=133385 RepID=A0A2T9Y6M2_9FUNG|nr:hypothetical protein BB561_006091 [Smittium simulii]
MQLIITPESCQNKNNTCKDYFYDFSKNQSLSDFTIEHCKKNVAFVDSELHILVTKECSTLLTYKYPLDNAKIEFDMKAANVNGIATSISVYGENNDEIDIEIVGKNLTEFQAMYYREGKHNSQKVLNISSDPVSNLAETFHKYTIEKDSKTIKWYLDGKVVRTINSTDPNFPSTSNIVKFNCWNGVQVQDWAGVNDWKTSPIFMAIKSIKYTPKC